jgi:uncharacterized glyoxalase superfamily protein PhnB
MKTKHLAPMLGTNNLKRTIKFYQENLGFECLGIYPDKENPCWVSLWNGEVEIAFSAHQKKLSMTGTIYLYVEDVEEIWKQLQNRVEIVYPLKDFDYGMREFGIRDCNGYTLNIGQNIE